MIFTRGCWRRCSIATGSRGGGRRAWPRSMPTPLPAISHRSARASCAGSEREETMARIGFLGLGNMGLPMAANLAKAGHEVEGWDIAPAARQRFAARGGRLAADAAQAAAGEIVITMLPAGPEVRAAYLGAGGILACARPGALLIDCSTIDVETARAVAAAAAEAGFAMLDAPVSGGGLCPRPAGAGGDGAHDRACRSGRQRAGGKDLQQHDSRHLDDRGMRGLRPGRKTRPQRADPV